MPNWGDLHKDLATKIAEHIEFYEDFQAFRSVCTSWRSAAKDAKFRICCMKSTTNLSDDMPRLMISKKADDSSMSRRFYSLSKHTVRRVDLTPPIRHPGLPKKLLSSKGWLLMASMKNDCISCSHLYLLNPMSGAVILLPRLKIIKHGRNNNSSYYMKGIDCIEKFILSDSPSGTSDYSVALVLVETFKNLTCNWDFVAYWKNGNDEWVTVAESVYLLECCHDIIFYKGEFYAVDERGNIVTFDETEKKKAPVPQMALSLEDRGSFDRSSGEWGPYFYLVEMDGRLLLICRFKKLDGQCYRTKSFRVFHIDIDQGTVSEVKSLENKAVFIGLNSSFSIVASPSHGCKPNCIYYTDDYRFALEYFDRRFDSKGKDVGVYSLTDETFRKNYDGNLCFSEYTPPIWIESPHDFLHPVVI